MMYAASVSRLKATTLQGFLVQGGDVAACLHIMPHCKGREALTTALIAEAKARGIGAPACRLLTATSYVYVEAKALRAPWLIVVPEVLVVKGRVKIDLTHEEMDLEFAVREALRWVAQVAVIKALWPSRNELPSATILYWIKLAVRKASYDGRAWTQALSGHPQYAVAIEAYEALERFKNKRLAELDGRRGWKVNADLMILEAFKGTLYSGSPSMKYNLNATTINQAIVDAANRVDVWLNGEIVHVDVVAKLLMLKHSSINLDQLVEKASLRLAVSADKGVWKAIECPLTDPEVGSYYLAKDFAPAAVGNYAKGMITPFRPLDNVATFEDGVVTSLVNAKKYLARDEKLCGKEGIKLVLPVVWVVLNGDTATMRKAMVCGNIYLPTSIVNVYGCARFVGDNHNGLIKAVNSWTRFIDPELDSRGISLASGGCVKGGLDLIHKLSAVKGGSATWVETKQVWIAGEEYTVAVLEGVVLTMTNSFTITDGYTFRDRNAHINTYSDIQLAQYEAKLVRSSMVEGDPLLLDLVMGLSIKLHKESNPFPLVNAIKQLTKLGIIKAKPAITEVVHSEIDMLVNEHGEQFTRGLIDALMSNGLNTHKAQEHLAAAQMLTGEYFEDSYSIKFKDLLLAVFRVLVSNNMSSSVLTKTMWKRSMVVDLLNELSPVCSDVKWINIHFADDQVVVIPGGKAFEGGMMDTNANYTWIQAEGFFPRLMKHLTYAFDMINVKTEVYSGTAAVELYTYLNIQNEVQMHLLGKKLGRVSAPGFYGALVVSPFDGDDWYCSGINTPVAHMLATKHPVLLKGLSTVVRVNKMNPFYGNAIAKAEAGAVRESVRTMVKNMEVIFGQTMFAPVQWFLGTQNDGDGDQARLVSSEFFTAEHAATQHCPIRTSGYFAKAFHNAYAIKELGGLVLKESEKSFSFTLSELAIAAKDAAIAKRNVGTFTKVLQRALNVAPMKRSAYANDLLFAAGTFTQIEAMNGQKQTTKDAGDLFLSPLMTIHALKDEYEFTDEDIQALEGIVGKVFEANGFDFSVHDKTVAQAAKDYLFLMMKTAKRFNSEGVDLGFLIMEDQNPLTMLPLEVLRSLRLNPNAAPAMLLQYAPGVVPALSVR